MLDSGGGAEEASRTRVKCGWKKFRELTPILTARGASLKLKGKIYSACVRSVMIYGSETWPMRVEDKQKVYGRFERKIGYKECVRCYKKRQIEMVWLYGEGGGQ
jgi:hypothetical protein